MIRGVSIFTMAVSLLASMVSAEVGFDNAKKSDLNSQISGTEVSSETSPEKVESKGLFDWLTGRRNKEWTIMVFSSAKNNLEGFLLKDLNEMEMIGSTDKINIVAEVGRIDGYDDSDGNWTGVRRYYITKDTDTSKMGSKMVQDMGMTDMGDYKNLAAFANWAKNKYPAKRYMLIVSNHGSGWEKGVAKAKVSKGISYDKQSGNHINTPQLGLALKEIGKLDVFGTDACLMQMAEVVYEIKDNVDYIVGSAETEPDDGYPYNDFLGPLAANPKMAPVDVAKLAVNAYSDHYDAIDQGYTQSVTKASAVNSLLTISNAFADAIMASGEKELAKSARDGALNFAMDESRDLYDFARLIVEGTKNAEVKSKGEAIMAYITGPLVIHNRARDSQGDWWSEPKQYTLSGGIAVYLPSYSLGDGYLELAWAQASRWDELGLWINQP